MNQSKVKQKSSEDPVFDLSNNIKIERLISQDKHFTEPENSMKGNRLAEKTQRHLLSQPHKKENQTSSVFFDSRKISVPQIQPSESMRTILLALEQAK